MGKKRTPPGGSAPQFYASEDYKLWAREQLVKKGWTFDELAKRLKRIGTSVTTSAISQFLGNLDAPPVGSNTTLMPALNRVLGAAPPPVCNPKDPLAQLKDRLSERWAKLNARERRILLELLGDGLGIDATEDET